MGAGNDMAEYLKDHHRTEETAIKARDLRMLFNLGEKQVRNVVGELRNEGKPICSSSYGYWYSNDPDDLEKTIHRLNAQVENMNIAIAGLYRILQEGRNEQEKV